MNWVPAPITSTKTVPENRPDMRGVVRTVSSEALIGSRRADEAESRKSPATENWRFDGADVPLKSVTVRSLVTPTGITPKSSVGGTSTEGFPAPARKSVVSGHCGSSCESTSCS